VVRHRRTSRTAACTALIGPCHATLSKKAGCRPAPGQKRHAGNSRRLGRRRASTRLLLASPLCLKREHGLDGRSPHDARVSMPDPPPTDDTTRTGLAMWHSRALQRHAENPSLEGRRCCRGRVKRNVEGKQQPGNELRSRLETGSLKMWEPAGRRVIVLPMAHRLMPCSITLQPRVVSSH
jgi:hypothetical protein